MAQPIVEIVPNTKSLLGEGALWVERRQLLFWVDIWGMIVHTYDPKTEHHHSIQLDQRVGTIVSRKSGGAVVALKKGFATLDLEAGKYEMIATPDGVEGNRFNDGKCDPRGRLWAGTMDDNEKSRSGSLYCLETDLHTVSLKVKDINISNGICWSLDHKTMYYIDTPTHRVDAFDYNVETGEIANRRPVVDVPYDLGYPDGMTIDSEGKLWVALWGGSAITRWDPETGKLLQKIPIPTPKVTSVAFGGEDLSTLFVTTASKGIDPFPAGSLFTVKNVGVRGVPSFEYDG